MSSEIQLLPQEQKQRFQNQNKKTKVNKLNCIEKMVPEVEE